MIDHITFAVRDYAKSKAFYTAVLEPLGYTLVMEYGKAGGFGSNGKPDFWVGEDKPSYWTAEHGVSRSPMHVAFKAKSRAEVDAFYAAAIKAGAKDYGAPGVREHYHPNYYGAFVLDLDGNDIEAVFHGAA